MCAAYALGRMDAWARWSVHVVVDAATIEALAAEVRARAGVASGDVEYAVTMAVRLLGPRSIAQVQRLTCGGALRSDPGGSYTIVVRRGVPDVNFVVAHELGHWALREFAKYVGPNEEQLANAVGAAILAPPDLVRLLRVRHGAGAAPIRPLARVVGISQTSAQLRLGEVLHEDRAIVTVNDHALVRRGGTIEWDAVPVIEVARGARRWRGLTKAVLRGGLDEGRVALSARGRR